MNARALLIVVASFTSLASTACGAAPDADENEGDVSQDELRRKRKDAGAADVAPPVAPTFALPDGRYVIRGSQPNSTRLLGDVIVEKVGSSMRVVEVRTPHKFITCDLPVDNDGAFATVGPASNGWQWRYQGKVAFDGETLRFDLTETQVAPGWSTATYQGHLGLGSVLVQAAASNGGQFPSGVTTQTLPATWNTGYLTSLVAFRTQSGRTFITEPATLRREGCLFGYALELPPSASSPAATIATATGNTCDGFDPCNNKFSARLVTRPTTLSYSCWQGSESHAIHTALPTL